MTIRDSRIVHHLPTALSIIALIGIGWWGHHTGWSAPTLAHVRADGAAAPKEDWCDEHSVPESRCILCKPARLDTLVGAGAASATGPNGAKVGYAQFASAEAVTKAGVTTATVERQPIIEQVVVPAETDFDQTRVSRMVARSAARVTRVLVAPGDAVKAGQPVLLLDSADVGRAKSELLRALALSKTAQAIRERITASAEAGLRTRAEVAESEAAAQQRQLEVIDAEQALNNLGFTVKAGDLFQMDAPHLAEHVRVLGIPQPLQVESMSATLLPISPTTDGVVIEVTAVVGSSVETGASLAVVAAQDQMWVVTNLSPAQASKVVPGQAVTFTAESLDGPVTGTIAWVSPAIDEITRTVQARAILPNQHGQLRAHLFGQAQITVRSNDQAVVIPEASLQYDGPAPIVFIRRVDDIFEARRITLGARANGQMEVLTGLSGGEIIAVAGTDAIKAALYKDKLGAGCTDD